MSDVARPEYVREAKQGGWLVMIWAQPGARKTELAGMRDGNLCIRLAAPAVENKANKELVAFVAKTLNVKNAQVSLAAGESSRRKRLLIDTETEPEWPRFPAP